MALDDVQEVRAEVVHLGGQHANAGVEEVVRDDRRDGRGEAYKARAQVKVQAQDAAEARKLVFKEWGDYARVGTAVEESA